MKINLSMYFDKEEYADNYPDLTEDELIAMLKEDFIDTIYKQWTSEEVYEYLEVEDDA